MTDLKIIPRESEAQWLEERRSRVTATDIGRLANGGPAAWAQVKAEKLGTAPGFRGNRYTEWGHEREPLIIAHLEFTHGLVGNDALYVRGGRAATPDAVGEKLGEVKTTIVDWWKGGAAETLAHLRVVKPQYMDQVQWAQDVCGKDETVFAWEPHENFIPGTVQSLIIPRDEVRLAELVEVEERFLTYLGEDDASGEWDEFMARYHEAEREAVEKQSALEALKTELRDRAGENEVVAKTPYGSISYAWPKPRASFDSTAFKKEHPALAEQFTKLTPPKAPTLRITTK